MIAEFAADSRWTIRGKKRIAVKEKMKSNEKEEKRKNYSESVAAPAATAAATALFAALAAAAAASADTRPVPLLLRLLLTALTVAEEELPAAAALSALRARVCTETFCAGALIGGNAASAGSCCADFRFLSGSQSAFNLIE